MTEKMTVIAGPCVVEDLQTTRSVARELVRIAQCLPIVPIFKASYKKANRTSGTSFTGIGDVKAIRILELVGQEFTLPTLTDVHTPNEALWAAKHVDFLQIPAFLCRQTDLLNAAADTQLPINIKKGQFASVEDMVQAVEKIKSSDPEVKEIYITERGTTFGYGDLIMDMRNIVLLSSLPGVKCIADITHSLGRHKGNTQMIEALGMSAIASGAHGIFIETHPYPQNAKSDAECMLPLAMLYHVIENIYKVWNVKRP